MKRFFKSEWNDEFIKSTDDYIKLNYEKYDNITGQITEAVIVHKKGTQQYQDYKILIANQDELDNAFEEITEDEYRLCLIS
jgi:hypothetical protein